MSLRPAFALAVAIAILVLACAPAVVRPADTIESVTVDASTPADAGPSADANVVDRHLPDVAKAPIKGTCPTPEPSDKGAIGDCRTNADCNGDRCVTFASNDGPPNFAPTDRNSCVHDACISDRDCASHPGNLCMCGMGVDTNRCRPGNCHDDGDCASGSHCRAEPENYYKPHRDRGRFCTTTKDTCEESCRFCVYDPKVEHFFCDAKFIPPPG
jgi:hypothetical protein